MNKDAGAKAAAAEAAMDPLLREFLATRVAHCPMCRRSLRGAAANRCPECGHALALSLAGLTMPPIRWHLGFAGPIAGSGFHTLVIITELSNSWWYGANWRSRVPFWPSLLSLTLLVAFAIVWARWGHAALHAGPVWLWLAMGFGWLASAGSITLFFLSL